MLPPILSTSSLRANAFTFEHHRQPAFAVSPQTFLLYSISIELNGRSNIQINCGEKLTRRKLMRGDLTLAPHRFGIEEVYVEPCEFLEVCLHPSVVDRAAKELGHRNRVELVPVLGVVDPLAEETIYQLEEELTTGLHGSDYVNLLVGTLSQHLVRYYAKGRWTGSNIGGFPKYVLDRTLTYIGSNRDLNLSLEEVAQALGIEPDRFAPAFRSATGMSIRRYLSNRAARLNDESKQQSEH